MATAELQKYPVANNEEDLDKSESIYRGCCHLGPLLAWKERVDGCRAILKMAPTYPWIRIQPASHSNCQTTVFNSELMNACQNVPWYCLLEQNIVSSVETKKGFTEGN